MSEENPLDSTRRSAQVLRFSTRGISPTSRVQLWEGHNSRALIPLDVRTIDSEPIRARQVNLHLSSMRMAEVSATAQIIERSEGFIAERPAGMVAVFFITGGESFFYHRGGHISLRPGQAIVHDVDIPFVRGVSHGFRELVLTLPRELYDDLIGAEGPALPTVFNFGAGTSPRERSLAGRLQKVLEVASLLTSEPDAVTRANAPAELARAESDVLGLLRSVLVSPDSSPSGTLAAAREFIGRRLHDPDLSPGAVAAAVGISTRQLARIFAEQDTTVGRYIQARRLELGRDLLASPSHDGLSVSEIAARCGFRSRSNFGHAFRARYGLAPLAWRKEAQRRHQQL